MMCFMRASKTHKRCCGCRQEMPVEDFYRANNRADGLQNYCKGCQNRGRKEAWLRAKYGLSKDAYEAMIKAQGNCCAICGERFTGRYSVNVDHDHDTHTIRALLCPQCNMMLGLAKESASTLYRAIQYLHRYKTSPDGQSIPEQKTALKRTHCRQGHLFDEANTYLYRGERLCRTCRRRWKQNWDRRRKESV